MKKRILTSLALIAVLTGCASIVAGTSQVVSINSNVSGAKVEVNGATVGVTPFTGSIKRGKDTTVTVSKAGYQPQTITLSTKLEPIFFGNIIFGGLIGSTTDLATGAMFEYAPSSYYVNLAGAAASPGFGVSFDVTDKEFIRDTELKFYVMTNGAAIRAELAAGSGEHIDTLHRGFFNETERDAFIAAARELAAQSGDSVVTLGEKIAALSL